MARGREPVDYTRAEYLSDGVVHATGILSALIAVPVLITLAAVWFGDSGTVAAASVYGASLIVMLSCSAVYNMAGLPDWHDFLRRVDQSAIYLKIAGAYTPFAVLSGASAGLFLTGVWGAAFAGVGLILFGPSRPRWPALLLYLGIGWAGVVWGGGILSQLSPVGHALVLVAGSLYSFGLVFFLWERLPFHNTIWHVFVLAASWLIYAAVIVELSGRAPVV